MTEMEIVATHSRIAFVIHLDFTSLSQQFSYLGVYGHASLPELCARIVEELRGEEYWQK
jgi:hypothetical protein